MSWKLVGGKEQKLETVSDALNEETGERRSIFRYPVPGGWIYQFLNERAMGKERFESIAFVPGDSSVQEGKVKAR